MDTAYQHFKQNVLALSAPLTRRIFALTAHLPDKDNGYLEGRLKDAAAGLLWRDEAFIEEFEGDRRDRVFAFRLQALRLLEEKVALAAFLKYLPPAETEDVLQTIAELRQLFLPWVKKYGKHTEPVDYAF
jgi:hypothetical protein